MKKLVIYSPNESNSNDGKGFWSDAKGWGHFFQADSYSAEEAEKKALPKSTGNDARYVDSKEAINAAEYP